MSKEFIARASLGTKYWDDKEMNSTTEARQGRINGYLRVGLIHFSGLNSINWAGAIIKKITFKLKHGDSGSYNGSDKTFSLYTSKYQNSVVTGVGGKSVYGEPLGTFVRPCNRNAYVNDVILPDDSSALFNNIVNYLKSNTDANTFCLFIDENASGSYSPNYLAVTEATITIEYDDSLIYYGNENTWKPCLVYYGTSEGWKQVIPYYGIENKWQQV